MDMIQDWMIINKIKMGDPDAWDILVHKYYDSVYFYCVRRCYGDCDIASDLTQDIFLKLVESLPRYRFIGKFQNYLYTMAVNTCNNYLKKRHIEQIELTDNFTTDLDTYQLSVSKDKRLSGTWTLEQYEGQYRAAMYAAVKSANPNWKPGQKFDTSILDNVTRESVESTLVKNGNRLVRNSIDVSV